MHDEPAAACTNNERVSLIWALRLLSSQSGYWTASSWQSQLGSLSSIPQDGGCKL